MLRQDQRSQFVREQDEQLDEIVTIAKNLHYHAEDIDTELNKQNRLFKAVNQEMDRTQAKLDFVSAKLGKLLKTSDASILHTILMLTGILMVLIFLVIFT
jgi:predicted PurR-regulated permease PerM